ncbi:MAG TPA: tripartite tricarboxylate transporter permease [Acidimicrobiales bacterium]|nr:tripartite tricarboxylate transporter permease [Acidimicrobiales bacterium]
MFHNLLSGLTVLGTTQGLLYLFGGSIIGMVFGVIPGLGGAVVLSIVLVFTYHISLIGTICLFLATGAASYYSASVTSILLNTPAHPEAFAVTFDGFPMAQRGEAGRALGISAASTCIGGLIGCAVVVALIPLVNQIPGIFHPPEFVALIMIALLLVGTLGTDRVSKAIISAGIGIVLSSIGSDPVTGAYRFTGGAISLIGGISIVSLALGLFAVPQMVLVFGTATTIASQDMMGNEVDASLTAVRLERGFGKQVFQGIGESLHHWVALIRGAIIGVVCGIIPGIGGFAANFLSYGIAQQSSRRRELFGTGIPEGIIAPEASSISKEVGGMIPIIALGIPGGIFGALYVAALTIKGIRFGGNFTKDYPSLPYEMIWVIALSGIIGTAIGLAFSPILARVTRVPGPLLVPFIMCLTLLGPFIADVSFFSTIEALIFCIVGFIMRRLRYSLAAFAMGLVLGPTLENNIWLTHQVFPGFSLIAARPLADVLICIAIGILVLKTVQLRKDTQKNNPPILEQDPTKRAEIVSERFMRQNPYPQLAFIVSLLLFCLSLGFSVYAISAYSWQSALFPVLGGGLTTLGAAWRLPVDFVAFRHFLRMRPARREAAARQATTSGIDPVSGRRLLPVIINKAWGVNGQYSRELFALAVFCLLALVVFIFGYLVAEPVFVVLYGIFATRRVMKSMRGRIIYSVVGAATMWYATYEVLNLLHLSFNPIVHL